MLYGICFGDHVRIKESVSAYGGWSSGQKGRRGLVVKVIQGDGSPYPFRVRGEDGITRQFRVSELELLENTG